MARKRGPLLRDATPAQLREFYERVYDSPYHIEFLQRCRYYRRQVSNALSLVRGDRVLEIGCGEGVIARQIRGRRVVGMDISRRALLRARGLAPDGPDFLQGSADRLPFRNGSFECVCAFEVVEHLPEPLIDSFLSEMARVCVPGGWVAVSTPNLSSFWLALFRGLGFRNPEHIHEMDFVEVINRLAAHFSIVEVKTNTEIPWLKSDTATEAATRIQARLVRMFPPLVHLLHTQIFILARNRPPGPD